MNFGTFLSKRIPTNFFVGKNEKLVINHNFPGEMIDGEDIIEYIDCEQSEFKDKFTKALGNFKEDGNLEFKDNAINFLDVLLKDLGYTGYTGFLVVTKENETKEIRLFKPYVGPITEHGTLREKFAELNQKYKIKKSDLEFVSGRIDTNEVINSTASFCEMKINKAKEKREKKAQRK